MRASKRPFADGRGVQLPVTTGPGSCGDCEGYAARSGAQSELYGRFRRVRERVVLLDTGPLVSFLVDGLVHHAWAVEQWKQPRPPMLTCEPVLTEAAFLLKREARPMPFCAV